MSDGRFLQADARHEHWQAALDQCISQLQSQLAARRGAVEFSLGFCYLTDYFAPHAEALLDALKQRLPGVEWVGTVGVGVAAGGVEHFDEPALALMLAPLPRGAFRVFSGRRPLRAGGDDFVAHTALVHSEGATPDLQELLLEMAERTATGYLFGGLASARNRTLQIAGEVLSGGLSGVAFGSGVGVISRVTQGCQPIGPARRIDSAQGRFLLRLDERPALACVLDDLGMAGEDDEERIAEQLAETLVGLRTGAEDWLPRPGQFGPDTLVRHILGVDPQAQVLAIAEDLEHGMLATFCSRNPGAARADLARIVGEVRDELASGEAGRALGALYVSCSGRGGPHFGAPNAELAVVREGLGDIPLVGFFAGGEIARNRLYGYTGVLTVFTAGG